MANMEEYIPYIGRHRAEDIDTAIDLAALVPGKQDELTEAQLAAANSGINSEIVYDVVHLRSDLETQVNVINDVLDNPVLKRNKVTHTTGWTREEVIGNIDITSGVAYAVKTVSETALPNSYLSIRDSEGTELANRNLNGKVTDKWTMTFQDDYTHAAIYITSESDVTVDVSWGYNREGNAITELTADVVSLGKTDEKLTENVGVLNKVLDNPIMLKRTVTHSTGWNPRTIVFDGLNLVAGESYAIKTDSATALPSSYIYLTAANGTVISNKSLNGKLHDKWVINAAENYTNCSVRIDAASEITVDVSFGYNREDNAISNLRDRVEDVDKNSYILDNVCDILDTSLYLRKTKYCEAANVEYVVFKDITIKPATSYTLSASTPSPSAVGLYIKIHNSNGDTFLTYNMYGTDSLDERLSSSVLREGAYITAQYSGYDGIPVDITFRETNEHSIIDNLKTKNELKIARAINPTDDRRALITIIDDDGKDEFYDIYKPFLQDGYKITCAIDPVNWTGVDSQFMDWDQVAELKALGCEFVIHGAYPWMFPKQTQAEGYTDANALRAFFRAAQDAFKEHGLTGWNIGVYPQSNNNHDNRTVVKEYFKCVFGGTPPTGESVVNTCPITTFRIYRMAGIGHSDGSDEYNLQVYKDAIDEALANKGWLVILNHSQYDFNATRRQKLKDILDYAASVGVANVTAEKGFEIFRNILEIGDFNNKTDNSGRNANVIGADGSEYRYPTILNGKVLSFNQDGTVTWSTV